MLRDPSLIPLSRQHQHALALCVVIDRALRNEILDLRPLQTEIDQSFTHEIKGHFLAEEQELFPVARRHPELAPLVDELLDEHRQLREHFARAAAQTMDRDELQSFAQLLSVHIRKEERQLFEALQKLLSREEMETLGKALERTEQLRASCRLSGAPQRSEP
jgi:hemerythrin-like domain-containing protein